MAALSGPDDHTTANYTHATNSMQAVVNAFSSMTSVFEPFAEAADKILKELNKVCIFKKFYGNHKKEQIQHFKCNNQISKYVYGVSFRRMPKKRKYVRII